MAPVSRPSDCLLVIRLAAERSQPIIYIYIILFLLHLLLLSPVAKPNAGRLAVVVCFLFCFLLLLLLPLFILRVVRTERP